jgi:hypothetical protein
MILLPARHPFNLAARRTITSMRSWKIATINAGVPEVVMLAMRHA